MSALSHTVDHTKHDSNNSSTSTSSSSLIEVQFVPLQPLTFAYMIVHEDLSCVHVSVALLLPFDAFAMQLLMMIHCNMKQPFLALLRRQHEE